MCRAFINSLDDGKTQICFTKLMLMNWGEDSGSMPGVVVMYILIRDDEVV